jgi:alkanesulfonate monooxygenase SsuD/methylene tetrahydromethanopterin reductase-like flavin-dependent oxidoreductase (luciferase family)
MSTRAVSVLLPQQPTDSTLLVAFGQLIEESSASRLWLGQSLRVESHPALAYLAGTGCRIPVGIGVGLMVLRHPVDAAMQARSLAALMGQPVTIGYGAADPAFVRKVRGAPYGKPAAAVQEYLTVMRALLRGSHVRHSGSLFEVDHQLPPLEHPPVEVAAGVLREAMARAAGRCADAAITWLTPASYVRDVIAPSLASGAAGLQHPPRIVAIVHTAVDRPNRNPMLLAQHGAMDHLRAAHYTDMLRRAGLDVDPADPVSGARVIVEEGIFVYGKPGDVAAEIKRYHDSGVDEVVLNPLAVSNLHGPDAALRDIEQILAEVA